MTDASWSLPLRDTGHGKAALWLTVMSFGALAFVILAGTRPFNSQLISEVGRSSGGSKFEALLYLVTTLGCLFGSLHLIGTRVMHGTLIAALVLLAYCAVTIGWSATPGAGIVRLSQLVLVVLAIAAAMRSLGPEKILSVTYRVLVLILALNLVSVALVPGAMHQIGEPGTYPAHITSWKGVHIHKNYAGPVAAMTVLLAGAHVLAGRISHLWIALTAFYFLVNTNSKASFYVVILALVLMALTRLLCAMMGRGATRFVLTAGLLAVLFALPLLRAPFETMMNDPYALTGRVELWHAMWHYASAHMWTGSGFGSFWRIGDQSPILHLTEGWAATTGQGHSGYLDTLVNIGLPGLVLTLLLFCFWPCIALLRHLTGRSFQYSVFFGLSVFTWVHNGVETSLLSANHPVFFATLVGLFGLRAWIRDTQERTSA